MVLILNGRFVNGYLVFQVREIFDGIWYSDILCSDISKKYYSLKDERNYNRFSYYSNFLISS